MVSPSQLLHKKVLIRSQNELGFVTRIHRDDYGKLIATVVRDSDEFAVPVSVDDVVLQGCDEDEEESVSA